MKRHDPASGEAPTKATKTTRPVAVPQPSKPILRMHDIEIPKDASETKELTAIVKLLKDKNTIAKSTDITAIAAKTIKAVELSQKSGSDAFRREATKSLINLRDSVSKSEVLNPKRMKTLLDRFDSVSLDAKNAAFYMLETAKIQSSDIHKKAKGNAKDTTIGAKGEAKLIISTAETEGKKIKATASTKALDLITNANVGIKEKNLSSNKSIKNKKDKVDEDIKTRLSKATEKAAGIVGDANEYSKTKLSKTKDTASEITKNARDHAEANIKQIKVEKFKAMSELYIEREKNKLDHKSQQEKNIDYLSDRKKKQNDIVRDRVKKLRESTEEHKAKMKVIEGEAKSASKLKRVADTKEDKKTKDKKAKRDERSKKFNSSIMEGIYDANPLLKAGVNIVGGVSSGIGRALDWNKNRKTKKATELEKNKTSQPAESSIILKKANKVIDNLKLQRTNSKGTTVLNRGHAANDEKTKPKLSLVKKPSVADTTESPKKGPSLIKRATNKILSKKQPKTTKIGETGMPSGVGAAVSEVAGAGETGIAAVVGEVGAVIGGAVEAGGALVAGIIALSGIIVPVIAALAGIAGVVGLAYHFFGGNSDKPSHDVVGKITSPDLKNSAVTAAEKPSQSDVISEKQLNVDSLSDARDNKGNGSGGDVVVSSDNSVRTNNTTVIQEKLTTRNDDFIYQRYGYGVVAV